MKFMGYDVKNEVFLHSFLLDSGKPSTHTRKTHATHSETMGYTPELAWLV